jgi:DNA-binding MarR family transcriptional regulator
MAQWRGINAIATQTGITQREISDKLDLDTSSLIPLIDRLESKKLVIRGQIILIDESTDYILRKGPKHY